MYFGSWVSYRFRAFLPPSPRVVQNNVFNRSRINTVVVCALTSNLKRAYAPGDVLLECGKANLPKQSVVNVSQVFTVNKSQLIKR